MTEDDVAKRLMAYDPRYFATYYTIDSVNAGLDMSFEDGQDHEATLFGVLCSTADKTEGTSAFLEKRPAKFQGR